jgi:GNAT superfamily N-acetyltransferase
MAFSVRAATAADHPIFARLYPELAVPAPLPTVESFTTHMLPRVCFLEDESGEAMGYSFWDPYGKTAHVLHLVVDRRARGRRLGAALLEDVRRRALAEGCTRWYLNVKQDNRSAIRLYERCGFAIEADGWALKTTWTALGSLPGAGPEGLSAHAPLPDEDAALGAHFDFVPERLARFRARSDRRFLVLRRGDRTVAFAGFDPGYPGLYPFCADEPDLARPILDALRPHARVDEVPISVEGDRRLFERLRDHGATLEFATYRMGAALVAP